MIDLKKFRESPENYIKSAIAKNCHIDFDYFKNLDKECLSLKQQMEALLSQKNDMSAKMPSLDKNSAEFKSIVEKVQSMKKDITEFETKYNEKYSEFYALYLMIPNPLQDDVPICKDESGNVVLETVWKKAEFDFAPVPHRELLEKRGMLDQERSAKISGARFYYIKGWLVRLELALRNFVLDKMIKKWFIPTMVPNLVKEEAMMSTGFFPTWKENIYEVNPNDDKLFLIWTSEVPLVAQHIDETFDISELPIRYVGISPCYRREAGTYWRDTKWLIRTHQFDKIEMVTFVNPKDSINEHEFLRSIEEEVFQDLGITYNRILICSGDLWDPASKKYDLEAWFPGIGKFIEVTSTSNCTDFQARRWRIKFKDGNEKDFVHTLNWTVVAIGRALAVITETYQTKDSKIRIPEVLKKYLNNEEEL